MSQTIKNTTAATTATATAAAAVNVTPLYRAYLKTFSAEQNAANKTAENIAAIAATGLTVTEFFVALWNEGYKVPAAWPIKSNGQPQAPTSKAVRAALPEINRLVSALDMAKSRKAKAAKAQEKAKDTSNTGKTTTTPTTTTATTDTKDERVETDAFIFDKSATIKALQGLLVDTANKLDETNDKDAQKNLVELANHAKAIIRLLSC